MAEIMSKKSFVEESISMSAQSPLHLTEGQKACLRLVAQLHTSKEIGRTLGISPFTVDQRLDAARRKLNAATRIDAAKIFDAMERNDIYEPFVYETSMLESTDDAVSQNALPDGLRPHPDGIVDMAKRVNIVRLRGEIAGEGHINFLSGIGHRTSTHARQI